MKMFVISLPPDDPADAIRLDKVLKAALQGIEAICCAELPTKEELGDAYLLFALPLGAYGINSAYTRLLRRLRSEPQLLEGCVSALIVDGGSEFFTKSTAAELAFALNLNPPGWERSYCSA